MARETTIIEFGAVDRLTPTIDKIAGKLGGLNSALVGVATGAAAAVAAGVAKSVSEFERLGDAAIKLNVTAEALSGLGFAARQSGASVEVLQSGLGRLNKTIGEAASGNKQAADLFTAIGVNIRDASGEVLSADKVFLQLSDRFRQFKDGSQEAAIASALLGRSAGPELLQLLNQGSGGIQQLTEDAARLGVVIGDDAANAAKQFGDNLDQLKAAGEGFFNSLTTALLPALTEFSTNAAEAAKEGGLLAEIGTAIGREFNLFAVDLITAQTEIQQLGAEVANAVAFLSDWAENLGTVGNIAVVAFQSIGAAAEGNFGAAERGLNAITKAVDGLGKKAAADAAKRMGDLADSISAIKADAAAKIDRIKGGVEGLAKSAGPAAKGVGSLVPPTTAFGNEADKAAAKVKRLGQEVERLNGFNLAFQKSLRPTSESMQALVKDIDLGAISFGNLRESAQVLSETSTDEANFFAENWEGAVDAVYDSLTDLIVNGLDDFDDFGKSLQNIAKQFLGNIVKQFLSTNLNFGGTNFGSLFGGGGGGRGGAPGGGFNFGGPGAGLGTRVGLGATGVAIAYDGYQSGNALQGAAGGALAGFQVAGPVGAIVGALLGGLAAALNRQKPPSINVIGDDVVGTPGFRNLAPGSTFESRLGGFSFASIDSVDAQTRNQIGQSVVNFDNEIAKLLNEDQLAAVTDALAGFNIRLKDGAISAENILGERFNAILSTFDQATQDFVNGAATLEERTQRLADVLSRPQRLSALLDSLEEADRLAGMTPFEQALDRINKEFDAAAKAAEELGADQAQLARVEELRGNAIQRLNDLQRENLDALLDDLVFEDATEGLSESDREIAAINRRFDRLREQAIALGATQEDLELIERRRTAALRQQAQATRDSTDAIIDFARAIEDDLQVVRDYQQDFLSSLRDASAGVRQYLQRGSATNSLNPLQALQQSQAQFEELARLASVGDLGAIRNITGGADRLLQQAASFYGVGSADFQRIEALVRGTLAPIAGAGDQQSVALALAQLRQVMTELLRFLNGGGAGGGGVMSASQLNQLLVGIDRLGREPARAL
jgi:hypothetical protein